MGSTKIDYQKYFEAQVKPVSSSILALLDASPGNDLDIMEFEEVYKLEEPGYLQMETGYCLKSDGSVYIAVLTDMPLVTPDMWHWWFGWHGDSSKKYKLWHPTAHIRAEWADKIVGKIQYIDRASHIVEYIGKNLAKAAIQFRQPSTVGLPDFQPSISDVVYIVARIGMINFPLDFGWLIHQVRKTKTGAEMRSRFWLGGKYISFRIGNRINNRIAPIIRKIRKFRKQQVVDLAMHCTEEMSHLASFLPNLYNEFATASINQLNISGDIYSPTDADFEEQLMHTLYNKRRLTQKPELMTVPKDVNDVISIVNYAKSKNKKISICSGGHSWSSNHIRDASVLIDMRHFNTFTVNEDTRTAVAGPAVGGSTLLKTLVKKKLFFPAGHCDGVCIGGYLLQGGYGWHSRKIGMACENVIGLDIVTADGQLVHASNTKNSDLYWAARGAGPGFFGVVIAFHLKLHPKPKYIGSIVHAYGMEHLEDVFKWAYEIGPQVPSTVEFQLLITKRTMKFGKPGIEVFAPIFADTKEELKEAKKFMRSCPVKKKAYLRLPYIPNTISMMYKATTIHYPENFCWSVDNMWTNASIDKLLPYIRDIANTMFEIPTHMLWLNWHPHNIRPDMAHSLEDNIYIALYSAWKDNKDTAEREIWATDHMKRMEHLSTGIQLADENLNFRTSKFLKEENLLKLEKIRSKYDHHSLFNKWHSDPFSSNKE